jgi:phosphoribosylanthranilate isomerase
MILKVCGITNQEDADVAVEAGANAIGFNFYPKSPRHITRDQARAIRTPDGVLRVGVFVNERREDVESADVDVAQLHGDAPVDYPAVKCWRAFRVEPGFDLAGQDDGIADALVLDGPAGHLYGGAGKTFDWSIAAGLDRKIIVAGGLDASNVARAVEIARPWGVDACSRIERAPGKKDHQKMKDFVRAAKAALGL